MPDGPDPSADSRLALGGRVVTMNRDTGSTVVDDGVVYIQGNAVTAVQPQSGATPAGFEDVKIVDSKGTIFPGLVELHNHLPYDVLGLWQVPKQYGNRDQWSGSSTPDYHRLITGPMQVLGSDPRVVAAVVRLVEMRCLLGGTTTSQGITLATDPGLVKHFRGLVRNVEATGDPALPPAATHIADVEATDREKFLKRISGSQKMILHLAEGTDESAHNHFAALQGPDNEWAITSNLVGIHCVALTDDDFAVMNAHGGSMVWSPFSNLLLYGATAKVGAARSHGVPIALGSDWSPSGSINLLGELKVARLAAPGADATLTDEDLVAMATCVPARMLGWDSQLGSIQTGRRADLLIVKGTTGDPHGCLVDASEADISMVLINGVPRVGTPALMRACGYTTGEKVLVGGQARRLNLSESGADPDVAALSVAEARSILADALGGLSSHPATALVAASDHHIRLAVEGLVDNEMSPRPHLPFRGTLTGPNPPGTRAVVGATPTDLPALKLQPLTTVDDAGFFKTIAGEMNLPDVVRDGLAARRSARHR